MPSWKPCPSETNSIQTCLHACTTDLPHSMILPLRHGIISSIINCVLPHLFSTIWCRMTKLFFVLSLLFEWCLRFLAILFGGGGDEEEGVSVIFYTCPLTSPLVNGFQVIGVSWDGLLFSLSKVDKNHNILMFYIKELCPFQRVSSQMFQLWLVIEDGCESRRVASCHSPILPAPQSVFVYNLPKSQTLLIHIPCSRVLLTLWVKWLNVTSLFSSCAI